MFALKTTGEGYTLPVSATSRQQTQKKEKKEMGAPLRPPVVIKNKRGGENPTPVPFEGLGTMTQSPPSAPTYAYCGVVVDMWCDGCGPCGGHRRRR